MSNFFNISNIPLIIASMIFIISIIVFVLISISTRKKIESRSSFQKTLEQLTITDEFEKEEKKKGLIIDKWNNYWGQRLIEADYASKNKTKEQVGSMVFFGFLIIYGVFALLFRNFGMGLIPLMAVIPIFSMKVEGRLKAKEKALNDQIPGFLSTLKSNVQAGETPENALYAAIDTTIEPLRDEVYIMRSLIDAGSFHTAISTFRNTTSNKTLKFLCGCIELSSKVGSNLEDQITVIEGIIESNNKLERKLNSAVAENRPLLYVSMCLIPFTFMATYFLDETSRKFWFNSTLSWIIFAVICGIYGAGVFFTNRIIKNNSDFYE